MNENMLIAFGDAEIKRLPGNKIGGMLVRFSTSDDPDLAGEFFDKSTDFDFEDGDKTPIYLNHRMPLPLEKGGEVVVKEKIGEGRLFKNDDGVLVEAILYNRKKYEKALASMGWSSGTAAHLVDKVKVGKAHHIKTWPLKLDASITPNPCEPRNGVYDCKSVTFTPFEAEPEPELAKPAVKFGDRINQLITDREEDGQQREAVVKALAVAAFLRADDVETIITENQRPPNATIKAFARELGVDYDLLREVADRGTVKTVKGLFKEELAERTPSTWELDSAMRCVAKKIAEAARAAQEGGGEYDWKPKVKELMAEYVPELSSLVTAQIESYIAGDYDGDEFYLKSGIVTNGSLVTGGLDFEEHSELVVTALTEIAKRFRDNHEMRVKAGRVLSEKNRNRLSKLVEQMMGLVTDCQTLLDETKPMASDTEKSAAYINHQRVKHELLRAQIGV